MATVYNCLDALVQAGVAQQVKVERRGAILPEHAQRTGIFTATNARRVFDMGCLTQPAMRSRSRAGAKGGEFEIGAHGTCPDCGGKRKK